MSEMLRAVLAGLGGMLGWGGADFCAAKAMKEGKVSELTISFWFYTFGSGLLTLIVAIKKPELPELKVPTLAWLAAFAIANVAAYLLFYKALSVGELSLAIFRLPARANGERDA